MPYIENYASDYEGLIEGQVVDTSPAVIVSRTVQGAVLAFARAVALGTLPRTVKADVAAATPATLEGISVRSQATGARAVTDNPDAYPIGDTATIMRQGVLAVKVTDTGGVKFGDPVWLKKSDGTFSNADGGAGGSLLLAGAQWESDTANGAIARMRVNFDVPAVAGAA